MVDFSSIKAIEIPEGIVKSISSNGTILWELSGGRLPSEYQEVEYIQSSGTQYIDTNITSSYNVETDFDFEFVSLNNSYNRIFGTTGVNGSQYGIRGSTSSGGYIHGELPTNSYGTEIDTNITVQINQRHKIKFNKNYNFIIDDINKGTFSGTFRNGSQTIHLFNHTSSSNGASIKLYSCQMYVNNKLERDYVPCYRKSDNVIGLYDLVNNEFYTNAGSGAFTKGGNK